MATIAFIGCAHIHTPGFIRNINNRSASVQTRYVWDHDADRAAKYAAELPGAAVELDLAKILADPEVAAVIVCTETNRHEEVVLAAAAAGKHLFVEKPLGFSAGDAFAMADAIEAAGVHFQTGYFMRGDARLNYLKGQIESGAFGKLTRARGSNCHSGALGGWFDGEWRWMADPAISGCGGFGDLGTHSLDILLWLLGEVSTCTAQLDNGTARYSGCDETGEGLLRFTSGTIATLAAGWDDVANPVQLILSGTQAHATILNGQLYYQKEGVSDGKEPLTDLPAGPPAGLDAFLDTICGIGAPPLVSAREAAYRSSVMSALYEGSRTGAWITPATE